MDGTSNSASMDFEPQKLLVFLVDFFAILMPGAFLSYLFKDQVSEKIFGRPHLSLEGAEAWTVFLFVSYLLGHFVFLIGSWLDEDYDALRKVPRVRQIKRLAKGKTLSLWPVRPIARLLFKKHPEVAVQQVVKIKVRHLSSLGAANAVNAFQWSKARLTMEQPAALAAVQRFEADSKFFRSFVIALLPAVGAAYRSHPILAWVVLPC